VQCTFMNDGVDNCAMCGSGRRPLRSAAAVAGVLLSHQGEVRTPRKLSSSKPGKIDVDMRRNIPTSSISKPLSVVKYPMDPNVNVFGCNIRAPALQEAAFPRCTPGSRVEVLFNDCWFPATVERYVPAGVRVSFESHKSLTVIPHLHLKKRIREVSEIPGGADNSFESSLMTPEASLPLHPTERGQTPDTSKRPKFSPQLTPKFKHNLFRVSAPLKKKNETSASNVEKGLCDEEEVEEKIEGEEEEEGDDDEEEAWGDCRGDDSDIEISVASDEEYELGDEFSSLDPKSTSQKRRGRKRTNVTPGVWTTHATSRQSERRKAMKEQIDNESWFPKGNLSFPKLTQYLPSAPKKYGGFKVTRPYAPEEGRSDLPQDSEEFQKWLDSRYHRSRSRLAHGWRKSLGFRSKSGESLSGYRFVFRTSVVNKEGGIWQARVSINGQKHYVGVFVDPENAARAADRKAVELGMWPHELNFPEDFDRHKAFLAKSIRGAERVAGRDNVFKSLEVTDSVSAVGTSTPPLKTSDLCSVAQETESEEEDFVKPSLIHGGNAVAPKTMYGYRSVYKDNLTSFNVRFKYRYREYKLGGFESAIEAARAYDAKIVAIGKAAENPEYLNFPDEWTPEQLQLPKFKKRGESKRKKDLAAVELISEDSIAEPSLEKDYVEQTSLRPLRSCRARDALRFHANYSKVSKRQRARNKIGMHTSAFSFSLVADCNDIHECNNASNDSNGINDSKQQRAHRAVKSHVSAFNLLLRESNLLLPLRGQVARQSNLPENPCDRNVWL